MINLAGLPAPDLSLYNSIHFFQPCDGQRYKMLNYELIRSCPSNCSYCVSGVLKAKYRDLSSYHRVKPVAQGIAELRQLIGRYGFDFIRFWDEDFTALRIDYLAQYAAVYVKKIGLPILNYTRAESIGKEEVEILKDIGYRIVALGTESGNPRIRREAMNRHMSNNTLIKVFQSVAKHGIRTSAYNIIWLPREDPRRHLRRRRTEPRRSAYLLLDDSAGALQGHAHPPYLRAGGAGPVLRGERRAPRARHAPRHKPGRA
ncbi:hypothetical protein DFAR_2810007 [Desulfarculales bacterium]